MHFQDETMPMTAEKKKQLQADLQNEGQLTTLAEGNVRKHVGLAGTLATFALYHVFQAALSPVVYSTLLGAFVGLACTGLLRV